MSDQPTKSKHPEGDELRNEIIQVLKTVFDPEIPVDIYELGLIYEIKLLGEGKVQVVMTLTSPACPVAGTLPEEVRQKVAGIEGVNEVELELTFEPPWDQSMMSEEARVELGMF